MTQIVAADIGGTHARFALAMIEEGRVVSLGEPCTLRTADHDGLGSAWRAFGRRIGRPLPRAAAIAVAAWIDAEALKLTNSEWVVRQDALAAELGVERHILINDFGAVAHAAAQLEAAHFRHLCGREAPLPQEGVVSIVGPGTGLGVAQLLRASDHYHIVETEGGHSDFAPLDALEERLLARLRTDHGRVSVERLASGGGLALLYRALGGTDARSGDDKALWTAALAGEDELAAEALDRFCLLLGAAAGDIALIQGAAGVVIAGGLGLRLADRLPRSGFHGRFTAKGRFRAMMERMPVKLITHPQPGLFGAAAAFARTFER